MRTDHNKSWYLASLIILSVIMALHDGILYWKGINASLGLGYLYSFCFLLLLVLWVDADSKNQPTITRPFRYSFLLYIFILPYLPYYLWQTRRGKGIVMLYGFMLLYSQSACVEVAIDLIRM